jgi:hypothetical protein
MGERQQIRSPNSEIFNCACLHVNDGKASDFFQFISTIQKGKIPLLVPAFPDFRCDERVFNR